ncbi:MAG TPA: hypothetical protein VK961_06605 [Chthoniobacter sp.]|nr:hypothetical protein [Chthoniobacter sp.]
MKKLPLLRFLIPVGLALLPICATAQQDVPTRTIEQTYTFDSRGDAVIETSSQFSASDWAEWKERYGDHPDLLLRDLRYQFASAMIDDLSMEKDEVHRKATTKIKARALARYKSNGEFSVDVTKDLNLITGSGRDWFFTSSAPVNGVLITQKLKAVLPPRVNNAAFAKGGDMNLLNYSVDVRPWRSRKLLAAGAVLVLLGLLVAAVSFILAGGRKTTTVTIIPPPPVPPVPPNLPTKG